MNSEDSRHNPEKQFEFQSIQSYNNTLQLPPRYKHRHQTNRVKTTSKDVDFDVVSNSSISDNNLGNLSTSDLEFRVPIYMTDKSKKPDSNLNKENNGLSSNVNSDRFTEQQVEMSDEDLHYSAFLTRSKYDDGKNQSDQNKSSPINTALLDTILSDREKCNKRNQDVKKTISNASWNENCLLRSKALTPNARISGSLEKILQTVNGLSEVLKSLSNRNIPTSQTLSIEKAVNLNDESEDESEKLSHGLNNSVSVNETKSGFKIEKDCDTYINDLKSLPFQVVLDYVKEYISEPRETNPQVTKDCQISNKKVSFKEDYYRPTEPQSRGLTSDSDSGMTTSRFKKTSETKTSTDFQHPTENHAPNSNILSKPSTISININRNGCPCKKSTISKPFHSSFGSQTPTPRFTNLADENEETEDLLKICQKYLSQSYDFRSHLNESVCGNFLQCGINNDSLIPIISECCRQSHIDSANNAALPFYNDPDSSCPTSRGLIKCNKINQTNYNTYLDDPSFAFSSVPNFKLSVRPNLDDCTQTAFFDTKTVLNKSVQKTLTSEDIGSKPYYFPQYAVNTNHRDHHFFAVKKSNKYNHVSCQSFLTTASQCESKAKLRDKVPGIKKCSQGCGTTSKNSSPSRSPICNNINIDLCTGTRRKLSGNKRKCKVSKRKLKKSTEETSSESSETTSEHSKVHKIVRTNPHPYSVNEFDKEIFLFNGPYIDGLENQLWKQQQYSQGLDCGCLHRIPDNGGNVFEYSEKSPKCCRNNFNPSTITKATNTLNDQMTQSQNNEIKTCTHQNELNLEKCLTQDLLISISKDQQQSLDPILNNNRLLKFRDCCSQMPRIPQRSSQKCVSSNGIVSINSKNPCFEKPRFNHDDNCNKIRLLSQDVQNITYYNTEENSNRKMQSDYVQCIKNYDGIDTVTRTSIVQQNLSLDRSIANENHPNFDSDRPHELQQSILNGDNKCINLILNYDRTIPVILSVCQNRSKPSSNDLHVLENNEEKHKIVENIEPIKVQKSLSRNDEENVLKDLKVTPTESKTIEINRVEETEAPKFLSAMSTSLTNHHSGFSFTSKYTLESCQPADTITSRFKGLNVPETEDKNIRIGNVDLQNLQKALSRNGEESSLNQMTILSKDNNKTLENDRVEACHTSKFLSTKSTSQSKHGLDFSFGSEYTFDVCKQADTKTSMFQEIYIQEFDEQQNKKIDNIAPNIAHRAFSNNDEERTRTIENNSVIVDITPTSNFRHTLSTSLTKDLSVLSFGSKYTFENVKPADTISSRFKESNLLTETTQIQEIAIPKIYSLKQSIGIDFTSFNQDGIKSMILDYCLQVESEPIECNSSMNQEKPLYSGEISKNILPRESIEAINNKTTLDTFVEATALQNISSVNSKYLLNSEDFVYSVRSTLRLESLQPADTMSSLLTVSIKQDASTMTNDSKVTVMNRHTTSLEGLPTVVPQKEHIGSDLLNLTQSKHSEEGSTIILPLSAIKNIKSITNASSNSENVIPNIKMNVSIQGESYSGWRNSKFEQINKAETLTSRLNDSTNMAYSRPSRETMISVIQTQKKSLGNDTTKTGRQESRELMAPIDQKISKIMLSHDSAESKAIQQSSRDTLQNGCAATEESPSQYVSSALSKKFSKPELIHSVSSNSKFETFQPVVTITTEFKGGNFKTNSIITLEAIIIPHKYLGIDTTTTEAQHPSSINPHWSHQDGSQQMYMQNPQNAGQTLFHNAPGSKDREQFSKDTSQNTFAAADQNPSQSVSNVIPKEISIPEPSYSARSNSKFDYIEPADTVTSGFKRIKSMTNSVVTPGIIVSHKKSIENDSSTSHAQHLQSIDPNYDNHGGSQSIRNINPNGRGKSLSHNLTESEGIQRSSLVGMEMVKNASVTAEKPPLISASSAASRKISRPEATYYSSSNLKFEQFQPADTITSGFKEGNSRMNSILKPQEIDVQSKSFDNDSMTGQLGTGRSLNPNFSRHEGSQIKSEKKSLSQNTLQSKEGQPIAMDGIETLKNFSATALEPTPLSASSDISKKYSRHEPSYSARSNSKLEYFEPPDTITSGFKEGNSKMNSIIRPNEMVSQKKSFDNDAITNLLESQRSINPNLSHKEGNQRRETLEPKNEKKLLSRISSESKEKQPISRDGMETLKNFGATALEPTPISASSAISKKLTRHEPSKSARCSSKLEHFQPVGKSTSGFKEVNSRMNSIKRPDEMVSQKKFFDNGAMTIQEERQMSINPNFRHKEGSQRIGTLDPKSEKKSLTHIASESKEMPVFSKDGIKTLKNINATAVEPTPRSVSSAISKKLSRPEPKKSERCNSKLEHSQLLDTIKSRFKEENSRMNSITRPDERVSQKKNFDNDAMTKKAERDRSINPNFSHKEGSQRIGTLDPKSEKKSLSPITSESKERSTFSKYGMETLSNIGANAVETTSLYQDFDISRHEPSYSARSNSKFEHLQPTDTITSGFKEGNLRKNSFTNHEEMVNQTKTFNNETAASQARHHSLNNPNLNKERESKQMEALDSRGRGKSLTQLGGMETISNLGANKVETTSLYQDFDMSRHGPSYSARSNSKFEHLQPTDTITSGFMEGNLGKNSITNREEIVGQTKTFDNEAAASQAEHHMLNNPNLNKERERNQTEALDSRGRGKSLTQLDGMETLKNATTAVDEKVPRSVSNVNSRNLSTQDLSYSIRSKSKFEDFKLADTGFTSGYTTALRNSDLDNLNIAGLTSEFNESTARTNSAGIPEAFALVREKQKKSLEDHYDINQPNTIRSINPNYTTQGGSMQMEPLDPKSGDKPQSNDYLEKQINQPSSVEKIEAIGKLHSQSRVTDVTISKDIPDESYSARSISRFEEVQPVESITSGIKDIKTNSIITQDILVFEIHDQEKSLENVDIVSDSKHLRSLSSSHGEEMKIMELSSDKRTQSDNTSDKVIILSSSTETMKKNIDLLEKTISSEFQNIKTETKDSSKHSEEKDNMSKYEEAPQNIHLTDSHEEESKHLEYIDSGNAQKNVFQNTEEYSTKTSPISSIEDVKSATVEINLSFGEKNIKVKNIKTKTNSCVTHDDAFNHSLANNIMSVNEGRYLGVNISYSHEVNTQELESIGSTNSKNTIYYSSVELSTNYSQVSTIKELKPVNRKGVIVERPIPSITIDDNALNISRPNVMVNKTIPMVTKTEISIEHRNDRSVNMGVHVMLESGQFEFRTAITTPTADTCIMACYTSDLSTNSELPCSSSDDDFCTVSSCHLYHSRHCL